MYDKKKIGWYNQYMWHCYYIFIVLLLTAVLMLFARDEKNRFYFTILCALFVAWTIFRLNWKWNRMYWAQKSNWAMDQLATFFHAIRTEMMHDCSHTIVTFAAYQIYPANVACTHTSVDDVINNVWPRNRSVRICFVHHFIDPTKVRCCCCFYFFIRSCFLSHNLFETIDDIPETHSIYSFYCFYYSITPLLHVFVDLPGIFFRDAWMNSCYGNCTRWTSTTWFWKWGESHRWDSNKNW